MPTYDYRRYFTVLVPCVPVAYRTKWHPDTFLGPFAVLSRGAFLSMELAIDWAREHLQGTPYSLQECIDDTLPARPLLTEKV